MSRERTSTAGSTNSYGSRGRTGTGGSMDFMEARGAHHDADSSPHHASVNSSSSAAARTTTSTTHAYLRYMVDWIQHQPIPPFLVPYVRQLLKLQHNYNSSSSNRRSNPSINPNEPESLLMDHGSSSLGHNDSNYCIQGLDSVVFGTTAAADCVYLCGIQPPRYLWYMVSGALCDIFQLAIDITLHKTVLPSPKDAALCWMASFCLSIVARHTSHRYLVFGDYVPNYWQSLGRMYAGYSFSIVLSTTFNYMITTGVVQVSHYVAYVFTLLWSGLANYVILKKLWKIGDAKPTGSTSSAPSLSATGVSSSLPP